MTDTCARCGNANSDRKLYPPGEWVEYLQVERQLAAPEGSLAVPLCGDCHDRLSLLRRKFERLDALDEDATTATRDRVRDALDDLELAALADESGPDHDVSSLQ